MDTLITTMTQAFPPLKQWVIPSYQRNYVWTEKEQWAPLWEDLMALVERVRNGIVEDSDVDPHFLGTIITKHSPSFRPGRLIGYWWVVDGQQRLTTLQLLMAAGRAVFIQRGLSQHASMLAGVLGNEKAFLGGSGDRYKIRHKRSATYPGSDYDAFWNIIESSEAAPDTDAPTGSSLGCCYNYYRGAMSARLDALDAGDRADYATAFNRAILQRLVVADIQLGQRQNSHAIFEALNARGKPLTEWEKTKNYLLSLAVAVRRGDPHGDETYQEYFERYDADPYWRDRMDELLLHFAWVEIPRVRKQVAGAEPAEPGPLRANRLYREFRYIGEHLYRGEWSELKAMLARLRDYADIYRDIDEGRKAADGGFSPYALKVMERRHVLRLSLLAPILMILIRRLGKGPEFESSLRIIDSYLMRRIALKAKYRGFDVVAFSMVQVLRDEEAIGQLPSILLSRLMSIRGWNWWPRDHEVTTHFSSGDMYHGISSRRLRELLEGIAEAMHQENKTITPRSFPGLDGDETVEHVAPQRWQAHWARVFNFNGSEEGASRIGGLVNRIGNLTIVSYNSPMGNSPWAAKRKSIAKDGLELNRRLLGDMKGGVWNEDEINRRSIQLAGYVNRLWPHGEKLAGTLGMQLPEQNLPEDTHPQAEDSPPQKRRSERGRKVSAATLYAQFYRPIVARLRENGVLPVGKGGWRGKWRSFQTGHRDSVYGTRVGKDSLSVFLSARRRWYEALRQHRESIAARVDGTILWRDEGREIRLARDEGVDLTGPESDLDLAREWMAANLLTLRAAVQPHLDQIMAADAELDAQEGPAA